MQNKIIDYEYNISHFTFYGNHDYNRDYTKTDPKPIGAAMSNERKPGCVNAKKPLLVL